VTSLRVLEGGGETSPVTECAMCGMGHAGACRMLERHLRHLQLLGRSPNGIEARRLALQRTAAALAPVALVDATYEDLLGWREALTVTAGTVRSYVSHVRHFMTWAQSEGIRPDNPAGRLPVPPKRPTLPRPISEQALMVALESAPPRIRLWLVLAAFCGLRACEVAGVRRECVRENAPSPFLIVAGDSAKGRRERVIPLSPFVVEEIRAAGLPNRGYCFRRLDGQPGANSPAMLSHLANEHLRRSGTTATFHSLRHRFASQAYASSRDLMAVRDLMGHADVSTTQVYVAFSSQSAVDAVNSLPVPPRLQLVGSDPSRGGK
jgi:integrase/recombinase XerC